MSFTTRTVESLQHRMNKKIMKTKNKKLIVSGIHCLLWAVLVCSLIMQMTYDYSAEEPLEAFLQNGVFGACARVSRHGRHSKQQSLERPKKHREQSEKSIALPIGIAIIAAI